MTHLRPDDDGPYLPVAEIVRRANGEFGYAHCDSMLGLRYIGQRLLDSAQGLSHDEKDQALALVAESIQLIVGDDRQSDEDFLKCYVIPNEPLVIEYVYAGHEARVEPLLVRFASSLGYRICRV